MSDPQNNAPETEDMNQGNALAAAEYSLGLLEGEELKAAKERMASDDGFMWRTVWWDNWFAPLTDDMKGAEPDPAVWQRISAQVGASVATSQASSGAEVIDISDKLTARLKRWQMTAGITSAAAAVLAAVMVFGPGTTQPVPGTGDTPPMASLDAPLVAQVPIGDTGLRLDVTYVPESERLLVGAIGLTPDGIHDHELWLVPADGSALQSLGVVKPGEVLMQDLSADIASNMGDGVQLVLTREPIGGKPEGVDAGPVVAEGAFSTV
ncbi:MAG: anti-sigma factor [Pseudomonadota bacterium]